MTIKALYPSTRPTLDLNFARTRRLDPRITFTRDSTGTFVGSNGLVQTAASGVPRFDFNPTTGESLGLLVEEARINLFARSQEFDSGYLDTSTGVSVVANTSIAPDGTLTADLLREDASAGTHQRLNWYVYSIGAGQYYTSSAFVKPAGRTVVTFEYRDNINTIFNYLNIILLIF